MRRAAFQTSVDTLRDAPKTQKMATTVLVPQGYSVATGRAQPLCTETVRYAGGIGYAGFGSASNGRSENGNSVAGQLKILTLHYSLVRGMCSAISTIKETPNPTETSKSNP